MEREIIQQLLDKANNRAAELGYEEGTHDRSSFVNGYIASAFEMVLLELDLPKSQLNKLIEKTK